LPIHLTTDFSAYEDLTDETKAELSNLAILLVSKGARLDIPHEGLLPIHYVCAKQNGNLEVLKAILKTGFDANSKDIIGWTGLDYAKSAGFSQLVNLLNDMKTELKEKDMGNNVSDTAEASMQGEALGGAIVEEIHESFVSIGTAISDTVNEIGMEIGKSIGEAIGPAMLKYAQYKLLIEFMAGGILPGMLFSIKSLSARRALDLNALELTDDVLYV
jgi:hypothetical protein